MRNWVRTLAWGATGNIIRNTDEPDMTTCSAALCQVFDSIFNDLPMARVKFNVNTEYAYIQNFKILQSQYDRTGREPDRC